MIPYHFLQDVSVEDVLYKKPIKAEEIEIPELKDGVSWDVKPTSLGDSNLLSVR